MYENDNLHFIQILLIITNNISFLFNFVAPIHKFSFELLKIIILIIGTIYKQIYKSKIIYLTKTYSIFYFIIFYFIIFYFINDRWKLLLTNKLIQIFE
jgi:hypothetical protein